MDKVNQDERARRLQELMREKEEALARRRAGVDVAPSDHHVQNVAAASLMAATAAWITGFSPEWIAALGLIGQALAALSDLQPVFLGIAVGCLFAGFKQLNAGRDETASPASRQPATLILWLSLLFLVLSLIPTLT